MFDGLIELLGLDAAAPANMAELVPYLLQFGVKLALLLAIIGMFRSIMNALITRNPRV